MESLFDKILGRDEPIVGLRESDAIVVAENNLVGLSYLNNIESLWGTT